ncbi:caspase, EACC1-associated type [Micromonospora sp. URMC 103]|uniref:caspase, EACC1-associated type n=1 Tax=Micromonospora sp. URMC 103 TaxID=3423406 RepID=UPI003F1D4791
MTLPVNDYSDSRAILIAVSRYEDDAFRDVPAAETSLQRVLSVLTDSLLCGWPEDRVEVILNPPEPTKLAQRLRRLAEETYGTLLVYFVGHGVLTEIGELCLVLGSTEASDPDLTGLEFERLRRALIASPAQTKIVILDCCYSGRVIQGLSRASEQELADATQIAGAYTLTAADQAAHVPPREEQDQGLCTSFTDSLVGAIRDGVQNSSPVLTLGVLYPEVKKRLRARGLPIPNHRGTDTAYLFPFAWNASYDFAKSSSANGVITSLALTISEDGVVGFDGVELGTQLARLLEQSPLNGLDGHGLESVRNSPGVYQLVRQSGTGKPEVVYVGSARESLRVRLQQHQRKLSGRQGIDPDAILFSCLPMTQDLVSLGLQLVATPNFRSLNPEWNRNGFGNADPGRRRDGARVPESHFDALFPIDLTYRLEWPAPGPMSVRHALDHVKRQLPYVFRYDRGDSRLDEAAFEAPSRWSSADQAFKMIATAVGEGWQITAMLGYVTMYQDLVCYPSAWRYYRGTSVADQTPDLVRHDATSAS